MNDDDPQLLDEAMRICNEVARQVRAHNTYYRNKEAHITHVAEYGAGLAELCAERIGRLKDIRRGKDAPEPQGKMFLSQSKENSNVRTRRTTCNWF